MDNLVISWIRTMVPALVGALVTWLVTLGINVPAEASAGLTSFLFTMFTGVYYLVVRKLEKRWPQLGFLLGIPAQPDYK